MIAAAALFLLQAQGDVLEDHLRTLTPPQRQMFLQSREEVSRTVVFKLQDDLGTQTLQGTLQGASASLTEGLANQYVEAYLDVPAEDLISLRNRGIERGAWPIPPDMTQYYQVVTASKTEAGELATWLKTFPEVQHAYIPGLPAPPPVDRPPTTPLWETFVEPMYDGTVGINLNSVRHILGVQGSKMRATDCEYSWIYDHEDIELTQGAYVGGLQEGFPGGLFIDHGTAVVGQFFMQNNEYGMIGGNPYCTVRLATQWRDNGTNNPTRSILQAALHSEAGDVIMLQIQTTGPNSEFLPEEWNQASFDMIVNAVAAGMYVIAAAGNGNVDLDDPTYAGAFDRGTRDSGALFVGGASSTAPHTRLAFSNYGAIIDMFAWGELISTAGYGDLFFPADPLQGYTTVFSGTSSATGMAVGALIGILGAMERHGFAAPSVADLRTGIAATGTPQDAADALVSPIGVMPDLEALLTHFAMPTGLSNAYETPIAVSFTFDLEEQPDRAWTLVRALNVLATSTPEGVFVLGNKKQKVLTSGVLDPLGFDSFSANVPNSPGLIGKIIYCQALFEDVGGGNGAWSNGTTVLITP